MSKIIAEKDIQSTIKETLRDVSSVLKSTLGPSGNNILLKNNYVPHITKDGISVLREISFEDSSKNLIVNILKNTINDILSEVGDSTTTSTLLINDFYQEFIKQKENGVNITSFISQINDDLNIILEKLEDFKIKITTIDEIKKVAYTSSNNDSFISNLIGDIYSQIDKRGTVSVDRSKTSRTYFETIDGISLKTGYHSPYFINDSNKCFFKNANVVLFNGKIDSLHCILEALETSIKQNQPIVIFCNDLENAVLESLVMNKVQSGLKVCCIKPEGFGDKRNKFYEDLSLSTGAFVIDNVSKKTVNLTDIGKVDSITVTSSSTIIYNNILSEEDKEGLINEFSINKDDDINNRIRRIGVKSAVIYVGADTEIEVKEISDRLDDVLNSVKNSIEGGVVAGCGITYYKLTKYCKTPSMKEILTGPIRNILSNGNFELDYVISKTKKNNHTFDIVKNKSGDCIELGIVDSYKGVKTSLLKSFSTAKMLVGLKGAVID